MKILTCNIRYYGADDGENGWRYRKKVCVDVIRSQSPLVICFQEMWVEQFSHLQSAFSDFETFGVAEGPQSRNPVNAIFYHHASFKMISAGGYWLSETPHVPGSRSWESAGVRLANWVRLEAAGSQKEFRAINTHLDHVSQVARENQARLICEDASAYPEAYPQILAGDINCNATNRVMGILREGAWEDTYEAVHGISDPGYTHHAFVGPEHESDIGKIDWIFTRGDLRVVGAEVVRDSRDGRFPSDHYFVSCDVEL